MATQSYFTSNPTLEPRPQKALPDSPPHTPQHPKDQFESAYTRQGHVAASTPGASPIDEFSAHFVNIPGGDSTTIGLGLGFDMEKGMASAELEKVAAQSAPKKKAPVLSMFTKASGSITNPYGNKSVPPTTLSALLRLPRRQRPALLFATGIFIFCLVFISRSVAESSRVNNFIEQRNGMTGAFGRRYIEAERLPLADDNWKQAVIEDASRAKPNKPMPVGNAFTWGSNEDELLALISFINAATGNSLPTTVDPSNPIEPSVLLGFDPLGPSAREDFQLLRDDVNDMYPLVLFGKMRDPWHRELIKLVRSYQLTPEPLIVDIDQRRDAKRFIPALERILGTTEFPQILLKGRPMGTASDVLGWDTSKFTEELEASGQIVVRTAKPGKKGSKEKERAERQRLLAPKNPVFE